MSLSQGGVCLSCPGSVDLGVLLPHLAGVIVEEVAVTAGLLLVTARARQGAAACPKCGTASARLHSRYSRRLADAAFGGRQVEIRLAVRRFLCRVPGCERRIFSEQVDGLTARYARKTPRPAGLPRDILADMTAARERIEAKYGRDQLHKPIGPGHDEAWEYGYISGHLAALRWVLGSEPGFLDT